mmetsp:Transcript_6034/g.17172  ORF Transcript_6034/g.17172 Transcript_6034/m.17172 type:complete len:86 (+) Transcript_6034:1738-1995(+)
MSSVAINPADAAFWFVQALCDGLFAIVVRGLTNGILCFDLESQLLHGCSVPEWSEKNCRMVYRANALPPHGSPYVIRETLYRYKI